MFELLETNEHGVAYYRNIDTNERYANTGDFWWRDVDGSGNFFENVKAPESARFVSNW